MAEAPMQDMRQLLAAGRRVAVTQQVAQADRVWTIRVEGQVISYEQQKTVSPFTHSREGMLWLDRVVLRKDDGEMVILNLNGLSRIEAVEGPAVQATEMPGGVTSSVQSPT